MKFLHSFFVLFPALVASVTGFAQSASLKADTKSLAPRGGEVVLSATATYEGQPAALGWSIDLPADWSMVSVAGPNVPSIAPETGATGTLEFAYTTVPVGGAAFAVTLHYPAGAKSGAATPTFILRANGAMVTLRPEPVVFEKAVVDPQRKSEK